MRIELPSPTWADAHHALDDAHTLTLPEQRTMALDGVLVTAEGDGSTVRVEVLAAPARTLTLSF